MAAEINKEGPVAVTIQSFQWKSGSVKLPSVIKVWVGEKDLGDLSIVAHSSLTIASHSAREPFIIAFQCQSDDGQLYTSKGVILGKDSNRVQSVTLTRHMDVKDERQINSTSLSFVMSWDHLDCERDIRARTCPVQYQAFFIATWLGVRRTGSEDKGIVGGGGQQNIDNMELRLERLTSTPPPTSTLTLFEGDCTKSIGPMFGSDDKGSLGSLRCVLVHKGQGQEVVEESVLGTLLLDLNDITISFSKGVWLKLTPSLKVTEQPSFDVYMAIYVPVNSSLGPARKFLESLGIDQGNDVHGGNDFNELHVHVMDALGLSGRRKRCLFVKLEIFRSDADTGHPGASVGANICSAETEVCVYTKHLLWDARIVLQVPNTISHGDLTMRTTVLEKEGEDVGMCVAEDMKLLESLVAPLRSYGVKRKEIVIQLKLVTDNESPAPSAMSLGTIRLRLGLLWRPSGQSSSAVSAAIAEFHKGKVATTSGRASTAASTTIFAPPMQCHDIAKSKCSTVLQALEQQIFRSTRSPVPYRSFVTFLRERVSEQCATEVESFVEGGVTTSRNSGILGRALVPSPNYGYATFSHSGAVEYVTVAIEQLYSKSDRPPSEDMIDAKNWSTVLETSENLLLQTRHLIQDIDIEIRDIEVKRQKRSVIIAGSNEYKDNGIGNGNGNGNVISMKQRTVHIRDHLTRLTVFLEGSDANKLSVKNRADLLVALKDIIGQISSLKVAIRTSMDTVFQCIASSSSSDNSTWISSSSEGLHRAGDSYKDLLTSIAELQKSENKAVRLLRRLETSRRDGASPNMAVSKSAPQFDSFSKLFGGEPKPAIFSPDSSPTTSVIPRPVKLMTEDALQNDLVKQTVVRLLCKEIKRKIPGISMTNFRTKFTAALYSSNLEHRLWKRLTRPLTLSDLNVYRGLDLGGASRSPVTAAKDNGPNPIVLGELLAMRDIVSMQSVIHNGTSSDELTRRSANLKCPISRTAMMLQNIDTMLTLDGFADVQGEDSGTRHQDDTTGGGQSLDNCWLRERRIMLLCGVIQKMTGLSMFEVSSAVIHASSDGYDPIVLACVLYTVSAESPPCSEGNFVDWIQDVFENGSTSSSPSPLVRLSDREVLVTVLKAAKKGNDTKELSTILDKYEAYERSSFGDGKTLLHYAVKYRLRVLVDVLLRRKIVNPLTKDFSGKSAQQYCLDNDMLQVFSGVQACSTTLVGVTKPGKTKNPSMKADFEVAVAIGDNAIRKGRAVLYSIANESFVVHFGSPVDEIVTIPITSIQLIRCLSDECLELFNQIHLKQKKTSDAIYKKQIDKQDNNATKNKINAPPKTTSPTTDKGSLDLKTDEKVSIPIVRLAVGSKELGVSKKVGKKSIEEVMARGKIFGMHN
eukprot:gene686-1313_t